MFVLDGTVYVGDSFIPSRYDLDADYTCRRPGVLVLINDADWELEGQDSYELQPRDGIVFVSTLHGG